MNLYDFPAKVPYCADLLDIPTETPDGYFFLKSVTIDEHGMSFKYGKNEPTLDISDWIGAEMQDLYYGDLVATFHLDGVEIEYFDRDIADGYIQAFKEVVEAATNIDNNSSYLTVIKHPAKRNSIIVVRC